MPLDHRVISHVAKRIESLGIEETLLRRQLPFNVHQSPKFPVLQCNMDRVQEWKRASANVSIGEKALERLAFNKQHNFLENAREATRRAIKAFRLAKVPLLLTAGTLLGWYRECDIIPHTDDLDFGLTADHIVSMEHFDLLVVGCSLFDDSPSCCFCAGSFACIRDHRSNSRFWASTSAWGIHHDDVLSNGQLS
jgi:hypothetical protein